MLCEPDAAAEGAAAAADGAVDALPASGSPAGGADNGAAAVGQLLPHTYDDADLYEQLLKEYLEGAGAPGGGAATLQRVSNASCMVTFQPQLRSVTAHMVSYFTDILTAYGGRGSHSGACCEAQL